MAYKPGDSYSKEFVTSNPTSGAATNADSLPTATADFDGSGTGGMALTVTNLDAGRYKITGTVPGTRVKADVLNVSVAATVAGVSGKAIVDTQVLDSKRIGDLNDLGGTAQTGDSYARIGSPVGASIAADIAAVKSETDAVKAKTDALPADPTGLTNLATAHGAGSWATATGFSTFNPSADTVARVTLVDTTTNLTNKSGFALGSNGLDAVAVTDPVSGSSISAWNFRQALWMLIRRFTGKADQPSFVSASGGELTVYVNGGGAPLATQPVSDDGATQTQGEMVIS